MDYVTDENPTALLHLDDLGYTPDYVDNSDRVTPVTTSMLANAAFADPANREYPCHTKAACWQSAAYGAANGASPEIMEGIMKFATLHGCREDCEAAVGVLRQEQEKAASVEEAPMEKYALAIDFEGEDGRGVETHYPINNAFEVTTSAEDAAVAYANGRIPLPMMRKVAYTICREAERLGVSPDELNATICRIGTAATPDADMAAELVEMRKNANAALDINEYKQVIGGLAAQLEKAATAEDAIAAADNAAVDMYRLDCRNNIRYSKKQLTPYSIIFTGPTLADLEKAAACSFRLLGVDVPSIELVNMSPSLIDGRFSQAAANTVHAARAEAEGGPSLEKMARVSSILSALPEGTQAVLLRALCNVGWGA